MLEMRRHYTNYFRSYPGIKNYRKELVTQDDPEILFDILDQIKYQYSGVMA